MIECPHCARVHTPHDALRSVDVCFVPQRWLRASCAGCDRSYMLAPGSTRLRVGDIDGGPGPVFMPASSVTVPGLRVRWKTSGATVQLGPVALDVPSA